MEEKDIQENQPDVTIPIVKQDDPIPALKEKIALLSSHLSGLVNWAETYNTGARCIMCGGQAGIHRTMGKLENVTKNGLTRQHRVTVSCPIGEAKKIL